LHRKQLLRTPLATDCAGRCEATAAKQLFTRLDRKPRGGACPSTSCRGRTEYTCRPDERSTEREACLDRTLARCLDTARDGLVSSLLGPLKGNVCLTPPHLSQTRPSEACTGCDT
jgi:hypothetical protein